MTKPKFIVKNLSTPYHFDPNKPPDLQITNVVVTCSLFRQCGKNILDLKHLALTMYNVEYNPRKFAALTIRKQSSSFSVKCTATFRLFASGKLITLGTKTIEDAKIACKSIVRVLKKLVNLEIGIFDYKVCNIVLTCSLNFKINLLVFASFFARFSRYEPEIFPGLSYKPILNSKNKLTIVMFGNGNINFLTDSVDAVTEFFDREFFLVLTNFKK